MVVPPQYLNLPPLVLASGSPRRAQLLESMGLHFEVFVPDIDERSITAPSHTLAHVLAQAKCVAAQASYPTAPNKLFVAADTVVLLDGQRLDKPSDTHAAREYLRRLAGRTHDVYTGLSLRFNDEEQVLQSRTAVTFSQLEEEEIDYYVTTSLPLDKAGGYGIQEWIGLVGVTSIEGSYTNVMGLPTEALHGALITFTKHHRLTA